MTGDQPKPSFRLKGFTPEEEQLHHNFFKQLHREEGNMAFPLIGFHHEVQCNYNIAKEQYAGLHAELSEILSFDGDKYFEINLSAIEQSLEWVDVRGAALFGFPGVLFMNRHIVGEDMVRDCLRGELYERKCKALYQALCSIKQLVSEILEKFFERFPEWPCRLYQDLIYFHGTPVNLDECLHTIMASKAQSSFFREGWRGRSHHGATETYHVFISHAGEDKRTIAIPLQEKLASRGMNSFLDIEELRPGDLASSSMEHAMQTAAMGVIILSPEFSAKRWPMRELECFLRRARGEGSPSQVLPVFYRLRKEECGGSELFEMENEKGLNLFESLGFYDRVATGETSVEKVRKDLEEIADMPGIVNDEES